MPIDFTCPHCGKQTTVADRFAGCTGPCAECGQTISVPVFGHVPAKTAAAPPPKPSSRNWAVPVVIVVAGVGPVFIIVLVLVALLAIAGYALVRFGIEFLRADSPSILTGLTMIQLLCLTALLGALAGIRVTGIRRNRMSPL